MIDREVIKTMRELGVTVNYNNIKYVTETKKENEEKQMLDKDKKTKEPISYKKNTELIEKRTRRVGLLLQPTLYKKIQLLATVNEQSVNDFIHNLLEREMRKF